MDMAMTLIYFISGVHVLLGVIKGQTSPPCLLLNAFWLPPIRHLIIAVIELHSLFGIKRSSTSNLNECEQASNEFKLLGFNETPHR